MAPVPAHAFRLGVRSRPLYVLLPPSYHAEPEARFPVLYALDGWNVWSIAGGAPELVHGGWWMDLACQGLWDRKEAREFILVGVPSGGVNRAREYCGAGFIADNGSVSNGGNGSGGGGSGGAVAAPAGEGADEVLEGPFADPFLVFLVHSVKGTIDSAFRTLPGAEHSAVVGSSLGGLAAWRAGTSLPGIFGGVACLSPSLWFQGSQGARAEEDLRRRVLAGALSPAALRVYLDSGDSENDNAFETVDVARALLALGWVDCGRDGQALLPCSGWLPLPVKGGPPPPPPPPPPPQQQQQPPSPPPPLHPCQGGEAAAGHYWTCSACSAHGAPGEAECSVCGESSQAGECRGNMLYVFDGDSPVKMEGVGSHCENVWAHRCARALRFLFPLQPGQSPARRE